jgi:5-methyltetrahydrofolate--homocysteine methyltransferase
MAETKLTRKDKSVIIGPKQPFVVIGERINPTNRKDLKKALAAKDMGFIEKEAKAQFDSGADIVDINISAPGIDEKILLKEAIEIVQKAVDCPLAIDTTNAEALSEALKVVEGKVLVNSVNGKEESLKNILPLVKEYNTAVVGLTMDEKGIPHDVDTRLRITEKIIAHASKEGVAKEDIIIDCLVLSAGTNPAEVMTILEAIKAVEERFGINTVVGLSNISFGLPRRSLVNSAFLSIAISYGLDAAIIDPSEKVLMDAIKASDLLTGRDEWGMKYITAYRGMK